MKILYLANLRLPTEKAYGIQIVKMCEAFTNSGHEVKLLCPYRKNLAINQDIFSYYSIKNKFDFKVVESKDFYLPGWLDKIAFLVKNYFSATALINEALKENADIYYTRDERVAYILSKKNKNVVFECHRFSNNKKRFYSHFKKIVAISNGLKEDLVKSGIESQHILVARDGVDIEEFDVQISKEEARKKFFKNIHHESFARKKLAVYIGNFYQWKGFNIFSDIAKYLCGVNVNYLICFFGGTNKEISEFANQLKKYQKHPNLVPMVYLNIFDIEGRVPHHDVPYILKAADCAILTGNESEAISAKYTSPLKMFEYMASGCPIVAQDLPSFREVLNNENSFLVEPGNAKTLAEKIAFVFENEEDAKNKATKAFEDVQKYIWQNRVANILNFLR